MASDDADWGQPGKNVQVRVEDVSRRPKIYAVPGDTNLYTFLLDKVTPELGVGRYFVDKVEVVKGDAKTCAELGDKTVFIVPRPRGTVWEAGKNDILKELPDHVKTALKIKAKPDDLDEIFLHVGKKPEIRLRDSDAIKRFDNDDNVQRFTQAEADQMFQKFDFGPDGRATFNGGAPHRISVMLHPFPGGEPVGFAIRFSRWVENAAQPLYQYVDSRQSMLLIGAPGVGKTTILKDIVRYSSRQHCTVVVDLAGEVCGNGVQPHAFLEHVRRIDVRKRMDKPKAVEAAVANFSPTWLVLDEVIEDAEVDVAVTAAYRGINLVATVHGSSLVSVVKNATTASLMGGSQPVILSHIEREQRRSARKACTERITSPAFDVVVEIFSSCHWRVITDVATAVDRIHGGISYTDLVKTV